MAQDIKVPTLPESVSDATVAAWHKKPGESVKRDENLVDIETDKVVLEVVAPNDGILESIIKPQGSTVGRDEVIGIFTVSEVAIQQETTKSMPEATNLAATAGPISPTVRRMMAEHDVTQNAIAGSGKNGRVTKEDVLKAIKDSEKSEPKPSTASVHIPAIEGGRENKRVPMTRLRARIAERLVQAQQTAAILTTFNEFNMKPVMDLRAKYKDQFEKTHGVRLGFMSFFTLSVIEALKRFPAVNASIEGADIIYHNYYDIGIAVSSPRGLVVPIIRNANTLNAAQLEKQIAEFGQKAKEGNLSLEEMTGGTFTISNGGVFGSLMSTPILNPPQSGILGLHKIEDRPVVENGAVVIRPMMYAAFSYDHRIIDGSESVRFLVTIKEMIEDPARLLLGV